MIVATILMDDLDCIRSAKDVDHADDAGGAALRYGVLPCLRARQHRAPRLATVDADLTHPPLIPSE